MKRRFFTLYTILLLSAASAWATSSTAVFGQLSNLPALENATPADPIPAATVRTNPFTTEITVDNATLVTRYTVMNMLGQPQLTGDSNSAITLTIDTTTLPKGIYLLVLQTANGKKNTIRVVKSE